MTFELNEDFFEIKNELDTFQILLNRLPITVVPSHNGKFEPKFLDELFDSLYGNTIMEAKIAFWDQLMDEDVRKGFFWEQVLEKHMPFTKRHVSEKKKGSDFLDFTEAKCASNARYEASGRFQATIGGVENKTGTIRACIIVWGQHKHKVFFMLIPHSEYSKWKSPAKIDIINFAPAGPLWNKYRCSFQDVIRQGV